MIKKIAWEAFKNTGDINAYLELKQIENIESQMDILENEAEKSKEDGECKNKWNNII